MSSRYALYWSPDPQDGLWHWACRWLGRDPASGQRHPQAQEVAAVTSGPARYGFHATLKPPFFLREGRSPAQLLEAVDAFVAGRVPFSVPPLALTELDGFLALMPTGPSGRLDQLAADCVRLFDPFRAPPAPAELEQRRARGLDETEEAHRRAWGYPYVLDRFRFHLTLTGRLADPGPWQRRLAEDTSPFCVRPFRIDALAVFEEPERGAPFRVLARLPFAGS